MHFADYSFILLLALILFGPKRMPEIARQVGKLLVEFRRASNEFKMQINDELRTMEEQDRQKKLETARLEREAAEASALPAPIAVETASPGAPVIMPPSNGVQVRARPPYGTAASPEEALAEVAGREGVGQQTVSPEAAKPEVARPEEDSAAIHNV